MLKILKNISQNVQNRKTFLKNRKNRNFESSKRKLRSVCNFHELTRGGARRWTPPVTATLGTVGGSLKKPNFLVLTRSNRRLPVRGQLVGNSTETCMNGLVAVFSKMSRFSYRNFDKKWDFLMLHCSKSGTQLIPYKHGAT